MRRYTAHSRTITNPGAVWSEALFNILELCHAIRDARAIDLSQPLEEYMPTFPTHSRFYHQIWNSPSLGDPSLSYQIVMHEHNGTHVDAPAHFSGRGTNSNITIDQIPILKLVGRGVRLDCRNVGADNSVSRKFVVDWEASYGALEAGDIVLFNFGWSKHWALRPEGKRYIESWPGVAMDTAEYLVEKSVAAIGVDTLSPDSPEAFRNHPVHPIILDQRVLIIENLCNLELLPHFFLFLALPLRIRSGSGSPVRAVALTNADAPPHT
jgi:arylformamidase